jgi:chorismate synthase
MASNRFGNIFTITTWGESHGKAIGVVIDGCPAGLPLEEADINAALALRSPGLNPYTSPRKEADRAEIYSGVFEGATTGTPISIVIFNKDADSSKYEPIKDLLRPGHANYTYLEKYGRFDYRGGGRSSGRETACRVAAGAVARKLLKEEGIEVAAFLSQVGSARMADPIGEEFASLRQSVYANPVFCPDPHTAEAMMKLIEAAKDRGDSLGGVVTFLAGPMPTGLGDPVYEKLEANLAKAMMSLPATKGFEIGSGFQSVEMTAFQHNDQFIVQEGRVQTATNYAGGTLGGISTGMPLIGRVAFKPTSSIMKEQKTLSTEGKEAKFALPEGSRHDPCVAIRAVPVVEAMLALVLADAVLMNRCVRVKR